MTDTDTDNARALAARLKRQQLGRYSLFGITVTRDEIDTLIAALEMMERMRVALVLEGGDTLGTFVRWNTAMRMHEGQRVALLALPIDTTGAG